MGLNDQVSGGITARTMRSNVFKEDVKYRYIRLKSRETMRFRVLPAYDFRDYNNANGWLPFILPEGQLTDWANLIYVSRFVGHGQGRFSNRTDILSMQTGHSDKEKDQVYCPLKAVIKAIDAYKGDWGYMMDKNAEEKVISPPTQMMICNIIELSGKDGVQVGVFPNSATVAMFGSEGGLAFRRTMVDDATLAQNYLLGYEVNDMTNPQRGPVLECIRLADRGEFSGYGMFLAKDNSNRPFCVDVSSYLTYRAKIHDLSQVLNMPTEEGIVQSLIATLNGRSPHGHHEYELLRIALPNFRIPAAPSAPALSNTVPSGFGGNPAAGLGAPSPMGVPNQLTPQVQAQPAQQFAQQFAQQPLLPQAPVAAPQGLPQGLPQAPVTPALPMGLPPLPQAQASAPQAQVQQPLALPQAPAIAPQMPQIPHQLPVSPLPQAPTQQGPGPVAPGDPILMPSSGNFTRETFLSKINSNKSGAV